MKRFSLLAVITILLTSFFVTEVNAQAFPDLLPWAKEEINYLHQEGIVSGYPNGNFGSRDTITRGDATLMLSRAKKLDTKNVSMNPSFIDVNKGLYYYGSIEAAVKAGYLNGYPNGEFGPRDPLTREQMAKIISNAYNLTGEIKDSFSDIATSWAKKEIEALAYNGIAVGTPTGTFQPKANITRAEFSVMLARAMNDEFKVNPMKDMEIHFIDVGQGDSTLIQTPDGANILIDAGIKSAGDKVVSFLKSKDVGKLDLVIATHPHADHIGGLIPVLNAFVVDRFVDSGKVHTSQTYLDLLGLIDSKDIPFEIASPGKVYSFDHNIDMTVLHADAEAANLNNASVVVRLTYADISALLTGDAEQAVEQKLVNSGLDLKSTIYKAGHHGSNTSSTQSFIDKVRPETTILSYGANNAYGHPDKEVVDRLHAIGSKLYSTADSGDIMVITNGKTYSITAKPVVIPKPEPEPEITYPININTARYDELQYITGVGEVISQRIIDYRTTHGNFKKLEDIKRVNGIGEVTFQKMKSEISI